MKDLILLTALLLLVFGAYNEQGIAGDWAFHFIVGGEYNFREDGTCSSKVWFDGELGEHFECIYVLDNSASPRRVSYTVEKYLYPDEGLGGYEVGDEFNCIYKIENLRLSLNCELGSFPNSFSDKSEINITLKKKQ